MPLLKLKKLKLNNNRLVTMPGSIHYLSDLAELDVRNNPDLVMPPKPADLRRKMAYYNIDFSLNTQIKLAGQSSPSSSMSSSPAPAHSSKEQAKARYLRRRKYSASKAADEDQQKVLQGMAEIAKDRDRAVEAAHEKTNVQPKKWDETLEKPNMNYSDIFDDQTGQNEGICVWEIENFYPNLLDEAFHGKFYEADCYIILYGAMDNKHQMHHKIFYWIGEKSSLDKKACAAIHAVNLRNFLGATGRTKREEMNDESDEFIELFGDEIVYIEGGAYRQRVLHNRTGEQPGSSVPGVPVRQPDPHRGSPVECRIARPPVRLRIGHRTAHLRVEWAQVQRGAEV